MSVERYLDLLSLVGEIVATHQDLDGVLSHTVKLVQSMLLVERCSILLVDETGRFLRMSAAAGIDEDVRRQVQVPLGQGIAGRVAATGEPLVETGHRSEDQPLASNPDRYTTDSFISIPIRQQGRTLGVINATNKRQRVNLDTQDFQLLQSVARFLALAIDNHRLFATTRKLHDQLRRTVESLPVGILTLREDGHVLTANPASQALLGLRELTRADATRHDLFEWFPRQAAIPLAALLEKTLRDNRPQERELLVQPREERHGSEKLPLRLNAHSVETPPGSPREVVVLVEDLSPRREIQELRRLDELKSGFISMMSHELRTPLTSLRGAHHLLAQHYNQNLDGTQNNLLRIVGANTERLVTLVNNILDIAHLDNQSLHLDLASVELGQLVRESFAANEETAKARRIEVRGALATEALSVWGDSSRLRQVLDHVIGNAIKFTPEGGWVHVTTSRSGDFALIDVQDSGEGIPPELREKIFQKFYFGDQAMTRRASGAGLGLYLARALTELHGGRISALDRSDPGAFIRIAVPLETAPQSLKHRETLF